MFSRLNLRSNYGFSMLEALIAVAILSIAIVGLVTTQAYFSQQTINRALQNCLLDAAASGVAQCQALIPPAGQLCAERGNVPVNVTANPDCAPDNGSCKAVTISASALGSVFSLDTQVCNFPP